MCVNVEVSVVQQEIPISKMPYSGNGSNPTAWPEVLLDNSGHKFKIKSGRPIGLNDEKPGFSSWAFY